jgi:hypothetical protein
MGDFSEIEAALRREVGEEGVLATSSKFSDFADLPSR